MRFDPLELACILGEVVLVISEEVSELAKGVDSKPRPGGDTDELAVTDAAVAEDERIACGSSINEEPERPITDGFRFWPAIEVIMLSSRSLVVAENPVVFDELRVRAFSPPPPPRSEEDNIGSRLGGGKASFPEDVDVFIIWY